MNAYYHIRKIEVLKDCLRITPGYDTILNRCLDTEELEGHLREAKNRHPAELFTKGFADGDKRSEDRGATNAFVSVVFTENRSAEREKLYRNGIDMELNGRTYRYVRYKRTAGNAKKNKCLFILEDLYPHMKKWNDHYLDTADEKISSDPVSFEAYQALTLSSIIGTLSLKPCEILIMDDQISEFYDSNVITPKSADGEFKPDEKELFDSYRTTVKVRNKIWDGEALLDDSVFNEQKDELKNKSMMLLRSHFFKSCAFRTRLQQWFSDNGITDVTQLNGYTRAKQVSDIKLVITKSSLKYAKFTDTTAEGYGLGKWLGKQKKITFGIVKTDKPPRYMDGKMVKTSYQLLNTIGMTAEECMDFLTPSLIRLALIKNSPSHLKEHIRSDRYFSENEGEVRSEYQFNVFINMINLTDAFSGTKIYKNKRNEITRNYRDGLRHGDILVNGTNATLFGNPSEFLYATIHKHYKPGDPIRDAKGNIAENVLKEAQISCTRFEDGAELCCARFPHITMGNLLVGKNRSDIALGGYFVLSDDIVCVNAINYNLQQKLNGADYDSDSMLITDDPILVKAVKRQGDFPVPYNDLEDTPVIPKETDPVKKLAGIDTMLGKDLIGNIVNLSQIYNSLWWTMVNRTWWTSLSDRLDPEDTEKNRDERISDAFHKALSEHWEELATLYASICELAVLSNIEIDRAKRNYSLNVRKKLKDLQTQEVLRNIDFNKVYKEDNSQADPYVFHIRSYPAFTKKTLGRENTDRDRYTLFPAEDELKEFLSKTGGDIRTGSLPEKSRDIQIRIESPSDEEDSWCTMAMIDQLIRPDGYMKTVEDYVKELAKDQCTTDRETVPLTALIPEPAKDKQDRNYGKNKRTIENIVRETQDKLRKMIATRSRTENDDDKRETGLANQKIIRDCFEDVEKILQKTKYSHNLIYRILRDIDKDSEDVKEIHALLFSALCYATDRAGKPIFYQLVKDREQTRTAF